MKSVLFVCLGNSCRSQMAEGFAKHFGDGIINASSAGLSATHKIAAETIAVMLEKGIDIRDQFPKDYEPGLASNYDIIVNMSGFEVPLAAGPVLAEWVVRDPYGSKEDVHRRVRDEIELLVRELITDVDRYGTVTKHHSVGQRIAPKPLRKPRLWERFTRLLF